MYNNNLDKEMTIKQQVLKEFPEASKIHNKMLNLFKIINLKGHEFTGLVESEEEAWIAFKNEFCKPLPHLPMNYKELVLEKFKDAEITPVDNKWFVSVETNNFSHHEDAWQAFYEQYCTDKPDLIIGEEFEFSNDGVDWVKDSLVYFGGFDKIYSHIRPIQNNPKLDQLKQLAEELGYNLTKQ